MDQDAALDELNAWTLGPAGYRCHQFVVDATGALTATADSKPIRQAFALAGLHLRVERHWDGPAIQRAHQRMASSRGDWPRFPIPAFTATITPTAILAIPEARRSAAIDAWCAEIWGDYRPSHDDVRALVDSSL